MARARAIPGLGPDVGFRQAAATAVGVRSRELLDLRANVLETNDIERVHDMRVASRRLRAALEVFAPAFGKREHKFVLKEVKRLADELGRRRDPDVSIDRLERTVDELEPADRPGLESLIAELRIEQEQANVKLATELERFAGQRFDERLLALAQSAVAPPGEDEAA